MRNDYFENETAEKSFGFKFILAFVALMILSIVGIRVYNIFTMDVLPDPSLQREPLWYNYTVIVLGLISLAGIYLTWNYKKIGVYTVIASLFTIVLVNPEFSLLRTLAPLFTLFVFVGYGLFEIIPKWRFFK
ncbi:MAG: hypothetical protein ACR2MS_04415 [Weeksellaceae bacterium]